MSTPKIVLFSYSLEVDAFRLLEPESTSDGEIKPRVPNVAVEITRGYRLTLEWDDIFTRYIISECKLKLEEQLYFAARANFMHLQR